MIVIADKTISLVDIDVCGDKMFDIRICGVMKL